MPIRRRELIKGAAGATGAAMLCAAAEIPEARAQEGGYPASSDILINGPIDRWDEGLPLGNGLFGAMIWGSGDDLRFSLDRSDLWDRRPSPPSLPADYTYANLQKVKEAHDKNSFDQTFNAPLADALTPIKIPAGRLHVALREGQIAQTFHLALAEAEAHIALGQNRRLSTFIDASNLSGATDVLMMHIPGPLPELSFVRPKFFIDLIGYPMPEKGGEGRAIWYSQKGPEGSQVDYALVADSRRVDEVTELALTLVLAGDADVSNGDLIAAGRKRVAAAIAAGYAARRRAHIETWRRFWAGARISVPDDRIQSLCDRARYFYGAATRLGAPAMPLQGVWTDESGDAPPARHGEYRLDCSLPLSYQACAAQGLREGGSAAFVFLNERLPAAKAWTTQFFGSDKGALFPTEMTIDGALVPGWAGSALSPTAGAWMAVLALRQESCGLGLLNFADIAYKFAAGVAEGLLALARSDSSGKLKLPLSSSPEYGGATLAAFLTPNTNWDRTLIHALLSHLAEFCKTAGRAQDERRWRDALATLEPLHTDPATGALTIAQGVPYRQSARHLGHAAAIYPFGEITMGGGPEEQKMIQATIAELDRIGSEFWNGYTFGWFAALCARSGDTGRAITAMDQLLRGFLSRNGFHLAGDQSGTGLSRFTNRTFSLEGNFVALDAVQEMLLQSWGGTVRIFPATNKNWLDVSFTDLRAENGLSVSAARKSGRTVSVRVVASPPATVRLHDPFAGAAVRWSRPGVRREGGDYVFHLKAGEALEGRV